MYGRSSEVWMSRQQVYEAINAFTGDDLRRTILRATLRRSDWEKAQAWLFARTFRAIDPEFSAFLKNITA